MARLLMVRRLLAGGVAVACWFSAPGAGLAQGTLEGVLDRYGEKTVKGYVQPIVDLFGANMNSGFFGGGAAPGGRVTVGFELVAFGSLVGDAQRVYRASAPDGFVPATVETATVFGGTGAEVRHAQQEVLHYRFSDGFIDARVLPFAAPQLRVGGILGSEVVVRYVPRIQAGDEDFPAVRLFGIGGRHDITPYLPALPVKLAGGVSYTRFTLGEYLDVRGVSLGVQASRSLSILTVAGGTSWERSTMNVSYTTDQETVNLDLYGSNHLRLTGGAALRLGILTLFGDAGVGNVVSFSGGLRLGI